MSDVESLGTVWNAGMRGKAPIITIITITTKSKKQGNSKESFLIFISPRFLIDTLLLRVQIQPKIEHSYCILSSRLNIIFSYSFLCRAVETALEIVTKAIRKDGQILALYHW